ncbi:Condensin complex subunit 2 [Pyrenophora tritici-repentis]|nr:Condensin complex protein [Pyrenophora tritici-repentis]KAI0577783.1 Condensin complex subunit 2 [Pyrenophora tritici-repentis]KAI0577852.1 Condensin complex subunit 2 [Pyrenophora tritici-repentis]KAI0607570.1 Condensin complex subunit 2 [Pyrenophora tritici-repentis]KAI0619817.1 Condensin complex subunit 2 [Pyrenophora tritici-repentis]
MARTTKYTTAASPQKTPIKVPLNDDRQEKAIRRHAQQNAQRNSMRASTATPARRRISMAAGQHSPQTPSQDPDGMPDITGTAVTPGKRVMPLLANFEEWMKMATDNKINANNSWNFALIDYFHEMSLLKEGDTVNFQKASCTLDGCVKIYTSRVDSVATDTGKLLSGLAENNKKMELEFSVDPLFKKASADFDEGGAKGLLLNHLAIDAKGRIVFDSSDDANDATAQDTRATPAPEETNQQDQELAEIHAFDDVDIHLSDLAAKYFPDLSRLDNQDVCPSMKTFDLGDVNGSMDLPFLKAPEETNNDEGDKDEEDEAGNRSGLFLDDDNPMGFDDDDDANMGGFDLPPETGFGEGGEIWAREAIRDPQARVHTMGLEGEDDVVESAENGIGADAQYGVSMVHGRDHEQENILSYFDNALKKSWAGPEHWRISRVKHVEKAPAAKRKEREPFEIDFAAPMSQSLADMLYTPATSNSTISLPKAQWKSKSRNLLPDDKHFNSRQLLRLFLKPKARMGSRREGRRAQAPPKEPTHGHVDEAYWAQQGQDDDQGDAPQGHYDADFFQDDGLAMPGGPIDDDDDFADARDHFSPAPETAEAMQPLDGVPTSSQPDAFGAQLVTQSRRFRPEYVQYARVAKRVDVKRLKDELWRGIGFEGISAPPQSNTVTDDPAIKAVDGSLTFTHVVNSLQEVYPKKALADISTSYCFICLLHLANEQGLVIENEEGYENLRIRKDFTADLGVGGD